jgi:hypothetical protein
VIDEGPIGAALSRNLGGATDPGEQVEAELDRFIAARRHHHSPEQQRGCGELHSKQAEAP